MNTSAAAPPVVRPFEFSGSGAEYFKIWIVNIFLTIVTLGIYSAWAKVRRLRYFYGNTVVDDHRFEYLADPVKILKGRIVAVVLLVGYSLTWNVYPAAGFILLGVLVALIPFIIVTASAFTMRNSAYRNIRFHFRRNYSEAYRLLVIPLTIAFVLAWIGYNLVEDSEFVAEMERADETFVKEQLIATFFVLGLLPVLPYIDYVRSRFLVAHTQYGQASATFAASLGQFYWLYISTFLLLVLVAIVLVVVVGLVAAAIGTAIGPGVATADAQAQAEEIGFAIGIGAALGFYLLAFFVFGYFRAKRTNLTFGNVRIGANSLTSKLGGLRVGWIFLSNTVAIILSLGLLTPWASVRIAKYVASRTELNAVDVDSIAAVAEADRSALGEEFGDAFDIDVGL
jgi:uncharacterized membrane protein YjgN (DUF898 family)